MTLIGASMSEFQSSLEVLLQWLLAVDRFGFAVLDGMPCESDALCDVAETFGFVRETNYGKWFDVVAEVTPHNLANTDLGLQAHTDNPYRDPVPTLQLLACLENSVRGGESSIVDGFAIAQFLQQYDLPAFDILARFNNRSAAALLHDVGHYADEFSAYSPTDTFDKRHDIVGSETRFESACGTVVQKCQEF
ncbi:MAG: HD domain-containing protein [Ilumatobacteraceae bacterium]